MGIQSSINSLLSQAQRLATFYAGYGKVKQFVGDQETTKNEAQLQTDIAAGNAPTKDGKVDTEWLQKRREQFERNKNIVLFDANGKLSRHGEKTARLLQYRIDKGIELSSENNEFYNDPRVQDYLKPFNDKNARFESALDTLESSISPELKNKLAEKVARASVEARTASINKTKSNFDEHTASLIKYYSKGSGNP